jgi:hypothetical protein
MRRWRRLHPTERLATETAVREFRRLGFCTYADDETRAAASDVKQVLAPWFDAQVQSGNYLEFNGALWDVPGVERLFGSGINDVVEGIFGCPYRVFFAKALRSRAVTDEPDGSFLWHADGGPSTCVHIMLYLDDTDERNGAIRFADVRSSRRLLRRSSLFWREASRDERARRYARALHEGQAAHEAAAAAGTAVIFWENLLHQAGWPERRRTRDALIFNVYPAGHRGAAPEPDLRKTTPYPSHPDFWRRSESQEPPAVAWRP